MILMFGDDLIFRAIT